MFDFDITFDSKTDEKLGWEITVEIKQQYKKGTPIRGLQSRHAIACVFSFVDYQHETCPILQKLSHHTRAFCYYTDGLQGFAPVFNIVEILREHWKKDRDLELSGSQRIDIEMLKANLSK